MFGVGVIKRPGDHALLVGHPVKSEGHTERLTASLQTIPRPVGCPGCCEEVCYERQVS